MPTDKWQEEAARLLPCSDEGACKISIPTVGSYWKHLSNCPASHRPAVAAALAKAAEDGAAEFTQFHHNPIVAQLRAEVAKLTAVNEEWQTQWAEESHKLNSWLAKASDENRELRAEVARLKAAKSHGYGARVQSYDVRFNGDFYHELKAKLGFGSPGDFWRVYYLKHDAAVVQGLEIALVIVNASSKLVAKEFADAIAAEIAKRKEKQSL